MAAMRPYLLACALLLLSTACGSSDPVADAAPAPADAATDARVIVKADADVDPPPAGQCRERGDCASAGDLCYGPDEPMCGAAPQEECDDDGSCGKGEVCHSIADGCSGDGVGSRCGFPCMHAGAPTCGNLFTCDLTGHCRPLACAAKDGFTCPVSQTCDPATIDPRAPAHAITHGCVVAACTSDATCPAESRCVNGKCQDGFGECSPPVP
jgi:hypothetical protein